MPKANTRSVHTHPCPSSDNSPGSCPAADASRRRILVPLLDNIPHPHTSAPPVVSDLSLAEPPQKKRKTVKKSKENEKDSENKVPRNLFFHWKQHLAPFAIESLGRYDYLSSFAGIAWRLLPEAHRNTAKKNLRAALDRCEKENGIRSLVGTGMRYVDSLLRDQIIPRDVFDEALVRLRARQEAKAKAKAKAAAAAALLDEPQEARPRRGRASKKDQKPKKGKEPHQATPAIAPEADVTPAAEPGPSSRKRRRSPSISSSGPSSDEGRQRDVAPPRPSPTPSLASSRSDYAYTPSPPPPPTPPVAEHISAAVAPEQPPQLCYPCDGPCANYDEYQVAPAGHGAAHVAVPEPWSGPMYAPQVPPQVPYHDGVTPARYTPRNAPSPYAHHPVADHAPACCTPGYSPSAPARYPVNDCAPTYYPPGLAPSPHAYYPANDVVPAGEVTGYAPPLDAHVFGDPHFAHNFAFNPPAALPQMGGGVAPQDVEDSYAYPEQPVFYANASPEQPVTPAYASPEQLAPHASPDAYSSQRQGDWEVAALRKESLEIQSRLHDLLLVVADDLQTLQELLVMEEAVGSRALYAWLRGVYDAGLVFHSTEENTVPALPPQRISQW
ncbi:hypothetical protein PsYK624_136480 [Phanerochaete sordida]|uniref:Uncharacterized protein n=1 Tax=Phanerochaete sordida TaxID=48140 RepID=A0A9P3GQ49_9APHY|nr:hypothetical protein PsYK624_136480 [Phanerochaete sordida]